MLENNIIARVEKIEEIELNFTLFNSQKAFSNCPKNIHIKTIGNCKLLIDKNRTPSLYYNRVKGFSSTDIDKFNKIVTIYKKENLLPCFEITPNNFDINVSKILTSNGFINLEHLLFMELDTNSVTRINPTIEIVEVTKDTARDYLNLIVDSYEGIDVKNEVIESITHYYYHPNFLNFIAYINNTPAGMGSLFINNDLGYIANDFTFENFRGQGIQKALLSYRINKGMSLGLKDFYTDVEFGTISHNNMEKLGFKTVYMSSFWVHKSSL